MIQKILAIILAISLVLGVSANTAIYAQNIITPQVEPQLQQGGQPITFQENQPPLATSNQGQQQPAPQQQLPPPQQPQLQPQNLQSPLLQNTPEGINQANNLANFNLSVKDKQSLADFFNKCPSGIILYKVNGQFYVFCFTSPFAGKLFGLDDGQQPVNIEVKVVTKSSGGGGNNGGNNNDGNGGNNDDDDEEPLPSICYFEPNDAPECEPVDGECPNDWPMNEDGNCHPGGECPEGYGRVDDDETGTCYPDDDIINCDNGAIVLKEEDCAIYDPNPPADPREVCYFEPNDQVCNPDENGECLEGMGFNEDGQCIPQGDCPDDYARLDDDETGRCYAEAATKICPPDNIRVLQSQACPPTLPPPAQPVTEQEANNNTSTEAETELTCEVWFCLRKR